jgi:hypothetical protein
LAFVSYEAVRLWWWGGNGGVVDFGNIPWPRSNPTPSAILNLFIVNKMAQPEEASASEINTPAVLNNYSGKNSASLPEQGKANRTGNCLRDQASQ